MNIERIQRRASFSKSRAAGLLAAICAIASLLQFQKYFSLAVVVGSSMKPTYENGEILIVDRTSHVRDGFKRGDIVVARTAGDVIVKRVVGLPGEEVEIRNGQLIVDETKVTEDYLELNRRLSIGRGRLATNRFGLIGDNRLAPVSTIPFFASTGEIIGRVTASFRLFGRN